MVGCRRRPLEDAIVRGEPDKSGWLDAGGQVKDDFSEFDNDWDEDAF